MFVYLVRHAIAVKRGSPGLLDDESRELTAAGIKKTCRNAAALAKFGAAIDEIWTSPLLRARQTATLLAEGLGFRTGPRVVRALQPGGDVQQVIHRLSRCVDQAGVALVGHEPDLGVLATTLLTGSPHAGLEFKKGAVACIEMDDFKPPLQGRLQWMLTSKQMSLMA